MTDRSGYQFDFQGKTYDPDGAISPVSLSTQEANRETERQELAWLKTGPEKVFLYVQMPIESLQPSFSYAQRRGDKVSVGTWLGTLVATELAIGPRKRIGFGLHSYRRSVVCRIFGTKYVGWYFESSGDYCRLRKAKRS